MNIAILKLQNFLFLYPFHLRQKLFFLALFLSITAIAQPANDEPNTAIELTVLTTYSPTAYDSYGSTGSLGIDDGPLCGFYLGADVWFKTNVPASGNLVVHSKRVGINPVVALYTVDKDGGNDLVYYDCASDAAIGGEKIIHDVALANEELFIRVYGFNNSLGGTFELIAFEPTQDSCYNARVLDGNNETEVYVPYTNKYATSSDILDIPNPSCGAYLGTDIWFEVDVPASGELVIGAEPGGPAYAVKPALTVYSGTCANLSEVACDALNNTPTAFGANININATHGLANQTIYIRMHNYGKATGGAFALAAYNPSPALPVELVRFTANVFNTEVLLDWSTASEDNNDYFLVEHSIDGQHFIPIGHLVGKGTTDINQQYHFKDEDPFYGENYYRLKQVDFNGDFEYSNIVVAMIRLEEEQFKLFPNPAFTESTLTLRWADDYSNDELQVSVTDALGRQVYSQLVERGSETQTFINCTSVSMDAGIYYVQLSNRQQVIAHRRFNLIKN